MVGRLSKQTAFDECCQFYQCRQFSPILISQELGKFKEPATIQLLSDENMSIKVSPVIKEVKVTYTVDEESMEIVVRIPSDYPLQPVEVLDIRKVGIPDTTGGLGSVVQQSIANHNGSIAEAIGLFKKNISYTLRVLKLVQFVMRSSRLLIEVYQVKPVGHVEIDSIRVVYISGFQPVMARLAHYVDHYF
ncbi:hypothetical protein Pst134EB_018017 [Puccinia striiformis f. sp. tritici]|nr:hypothetical protein Pst134EB_018017 [Puccinia striiformis f. sp. tritici]